MEEVTADVVIAGAEDHLVAVNQQRREQGSTALKNQAKDQGVFGNWHTSCAGRTLSCTLATGAKAIFRAKFLICVSRLSNKCQQKVFATLACRILS